MTETQVKNKWLRNRWTDLYNDNMWVAGAAMVSGGWVSPTLHATCIGTLQAKPQQSMYHEPLCNAKMAV